VRLTITARVVSNVTAALTATTTQSVTASLTAQTSARSIDPYIGEYNFVPDFVGYELACSGKRMTDDVTIDPIHVYEVANPAGGNTLSI